MGKITGYEIIKYVVEYGNIKESAETREEAINIYEEHKEENPCMYQIRKMII